MSLHFEPARDAHVAPFLARIRPEDRLECERLGYTAEAMVRRSLDRSVEKWAAVDGAEPIAMWGITAASIAGELGCPWLLTTPGVDRHRRTFLRETRWWVEHRALEMYPRLVNLVDADYAKALRWLRWLGFTIGDPVPVPPNGHLFCRVERRR